LRGILRVFTDIEGDKMARGHINRKELKEDEIQEVGIEFMEYLRTNWVRIAIWIGVIVLVWIVSQGVMGLNRASHAKAATLLSDAQGLTVQIAAMDEGDERKQMIDTVLSGCDTLHKEYASSPQSVEAIYLEGNCAFFTNEFEKALSKYDEYLKAVRTPAGKAKANLARGYAYESQYFLAPDKKELLDSAIGAYTKAQECTSDAKGAADYLKYDAMLALARLNEMKGDIAQATAIYEQVKKDRPYYEKNAAADEFMKGTDEQSQIRKAIRQQLAGWSFENAALSNLDKVKAAEKGPEPLE
jgi:hypothetical protein